MPSINRLPPNDWRDLQKQVNQILQECGLKSENDMKIQTVRGTVKVDVHALDTSNHPPSIYLCECKFWQSAVPKSIVHAFRTVVSDYGANWGFIVSAAGFQSGAFEAAANSNVRLLTWDEFQELFVDRWIENYMKPRLKSEADPLVDYTEPMNTRVFSKAEKLDEASQKLFAKLREQYVGLAFLALTYYLPGAAVPTGVLKNNRPDLPLRQHIPSSFTNLPDELLDVTCLRDLADMTCRFARIGISAFDRVFGERA